MSQTPVFESRNFRRENRWSGAACPGFSLLEVMVSIVVLALMLVLLMTAVEQSSRTFRSVSQKADAFQDARFAFDLVTRNLSQATLNTFWEQDDRDNPRRYLRASDLHFVVQPPGGQIPGRAGTGQTVFFQAPLGATANPVSFGGLPSLLNSLGYFVDFRAVPQPALVSTPAPYRYQLMQFKAPAEEMRAFATRESGGFDWLDPANHEESIHPVAANIIALVLWPRRADGDPGAPLTTSFAYNSRAGVGATTQPVTAHQLPPIVEVAMVAVDEASAARIANGSQPPTVVEDALGGLFQSSTSEQIENDLEILEARLTEAGVGYRIFRTAVPLRESRWSDA